MVKYVYMYTKYMVSFLQMVSLVLFFYVLAGSFVFLIMCEAFEEV